MTYEDFQFKSEKMFSMSVIDLYTFVLDRKCQIVGTKKEITGHKSGLEECPMEMFFTDEVDCTRRFVRMTGRLGLPK